MRSIERVLSAVGPSLVILGTAGFIGSCVALGMVGVNDAVIGTLAGTAIGATVGVVCMLLPITSSDVVQIRAGLGLEPPPQLAQLERVEIEMRATPTPDPEPSLGNEVSVSVEASVKRSR